MAIIYDENLLQIEDYVTFDGTIDYMSHIQIGGFARNEIETNDFIFSTSYVDLADGAEDFGRRAVYVVEGQRGDGIVKWLYGSVQTSDGSTYWVKIVYPKYDIVTETIGATAYDVAEPLQNRVVGSNIPIFRTLAEAVTYIETGENYADAINYKESEKTVKEYYIYNKYNNATASFNGLSFSSSAPSERYERFSVRGKACLLEETPFEMSIHTAGDVIGSVFSSTSIFGEDVVREGELYYNEPFYDLWDGTTYGEIVVSQRFLQTNMLIFTNEEEMERWFAGEPDAEKFAKNYDDIANNGESKGINETAEPEEGTTFGQSYHSAIFNQKYVLSSSALREIAHEFYDTEGFWADLEKGLKTYGAVPIESVISLQYFPLDMRDVLQTSPQQYIYFGGTKLDLTNQVNKVVYENGYKDMGTFRLLPTFSKNETDIKKLSWREFEPYQKLYIFLPYCGMYQLSISRYMYHNINVRYYFDINTGGCLACLIADGVLVDYFNGQCAVQNPLMARDYRSHANAQLQTLLTGGQAVAQNVSGGGQMGANALTSSENAFGAVGGLVGSVAGSVGASALTIGQTEFTLNKNHIDNFTKTKGGSTGHINEFLPQYVYFIFEIVDVDETTNLQTLHGKPSNASGTLDSFGGFLQVDNVNLICDKATDAEKNEIIALLKNGVII